MAGRHPLRVALLAIAIVAVVACSGPGPVTSPPSAAPGLASGTAPPASLGRAIDPALAENLVRCDVGGDVFPVRLLLSPGRAEAEADAAAAALRAFLADPDRNELGLPKSGWVRIASSAEQGFFVAPMGDAFAQVGVVDGANGWTDSVVGRCLPKRVMGEGVGPARWWLDPAAGPIAADATTLDGLLIELACASARSPAGRLVGPEILDRPDQVVVTFGVRTLPGEQDCTNALPIAIRIELPAALGGRPVLDGAVFPPADARVPRT